MLENSLLGITLSVLISAISPFIKNNPNKDLYKIIILVIASLFLALMQRYAGEDFKQAVLDIIGSASVFYGIISKSLDDPVARLSEKYLK